MTRDYDPDDPVVGDEQVVEGDAALTILDGFNSRDTSRATVLWAALSSPKHAHQLKDELRIPIASVYRLLSDLEIAGLIKEVDPIPADRDPDDTGKTKYYRRVHDQLLIHVVDDEPAVLVSERPPYDPKRRLKEANRDV